MYYIVKFKGVWLTRWSTSKHKHYSRNTANQHAQALRDMGMLAKVRMSKS